MSALTSRQGVFLLVVIAGAALVVALVLASASNRRLGAQQVTLSHVQVPLATDADLGYSEMNLAAPRVACSPEAAQGTLYADALPACSVSADATTPLPAELSAPVSGSVSARLQLSDAGELVYWLNGTRVWSSRAPRSYASCAETSVLRAAAVSLHPATWPAVATAANGVQLHLVPLAVTAPRQDGEGRRVLWSLLGGWDATALCHSSTECTLPPKLVDGDEGAVVLLSANRARRAALLSSGDLIVVETVAKEFKSAERVTKLVSSLVQASCTASA